MNPIELLRLILRYLRSRRALRKHRQYFTPRLFPGAGPNKTRNITASLAEAADSLIPALKQWLAGTNPRLIERALEYLAEIGPAAALEMTAIVVQRAEEQAEAGDCRPYINVLHKMKCGALVPRDFLDRLFRPKVILAHRKQNNPLNLLSSDDYFRIAELYGSGGPEAVSSLLVYLSAADSSIKAYYLRAIAAAGCGRSVAWESVQEMIESGDTELAVEAIKIAGQHGPERHRYLTLLLLGARQEIREAAAETLGAEFNQGDSPDGLALFKIAFSGLRRIRADRPLVQLPSTAG